MLHNIKATLSSSVKAAKLAILTFFESYFSLHEKKNVHKNSLEEKAVYLSVCR